MTEKNDWNKTELFLLEDAMRECSRFLERATKLKILLKSEFVLTSHKRSAARRASLDLSKSLSQFRKGRL